MREILRPGWRELLGLTLSVVIPTLNAAATLALCLKHVRGASEVIVVDGGSTDATRDIAEAHGARVITAPTGRAQQLGAGAETATGDWLLFLHADTLLGKGWHEAADAHMATAPGAAACFRFSLDSPAWQARWIERGVAARVKMLGLPYGDQGMLISRDVYDEVGGFRPLPLMEDVDLVRRIGRGRLSLLDADAVTSPERWLRDGWARRSARNLFCLALYRAGVSPARIARIYAGGT